MFTQSILISLLLHLYKVYSFSHDCKDDTLISTHNKSPNNITIGFLSAFIRYGLGNKISGAIPLAVQDINE